MSQFTVSMILSLVDRATGPLRAVTAKMREAGGAAERIAAAGAKMRAAGGKATLAVTAPLIASAGLMLRTAGDFEAAMNKVGAISGATGGDLAMLRESAKKMGASTKFSATQAAEALAFLAMAGFDATEANAALPGVLNLAAAGGIELGEAADIASNVLSGYGLKVEDLARVNDVLAKTFTSANTDLRGLGEAMSYAAPIAAAAGVDFSETAAAIGMLGDAGIQGSRAGTALLGAINKMLNPSTEQARLMDRLGLSFTDAAGKMRPLADILEQLGPISQDAGTMLTLFGTEAGPGMAALAGQGADALRALTAELDASGGTAQRIASEQATGLNASLTALGSAFEGLQIAIADSGLLELATGMIEKVTAFVRAVADADPKLVQFGVVIAAIAAAVGPVMIGLGVLAAFVSGPLVLVVAGIAAAVAALVAFWPDIVAAWEGAVAWIGDLWGGIAAIWDNAVAAGEAVFDALGARAATGLTAAWAPVATFFDDLWAGVSAAFDFAWSKIGPIVDTISAGVGRITRLLPGFLGGGGEGDGGIDGARAGGGPVRRGGRYLVGEDGPEIFEPDADGTIIPNGVSGRIARHSELMAMAAIPVDRRGAGGFAPGAARGGGALSIGAIHVHAAPGMDARALAEMVIARLRDEARGARDLHDGAYYGGAV